MDSNLQPPPNAERTAGSLTPFVKWVIARAAKLATDENDTHIRSKHLEAALRDADKTIMAKLKAQSAFVSSELVNRRAKPPESGYHLCIAPNCKTQISDGAPALCPKHQANACSQCKGRGRYVSSHNEAESPTVKFKICEACGGTGQSANGAHKPSGDNPR